MRRWNTIKTRVLAVALSAMAFIGRTEEMQPVQLPLLKVGEEVYTNVTVTQVTVTHIYFNHAGGIGSARLKNLVPDLQNRFGYAPAKAEQAEQRQRQSTAEYRAALANKKPEARKAAPARPAKPAAASAAPAPRRNRNAEGDIVVPQLHARSFRGEAAPETVVEKWLTEQPNTSGKFVLIDFWATWCGPCRQSIPHLNRLHAKFKDRVVVIGLSKEPEQAVRRMTSPRIDYYLASDTQGRMSQAVRVTGIPHALLIDPRGIVRFEGMPQYLDEQGLEHLLEKYGN